MQLNFHGNAFQKKTHHEPFVPLLDLLFGEVGVPLEELQVLLRQLGLRTFEPHLQGSAGDPLGTRATNGQRPVKAK